jgi:hypothetical protein
MNKVLVVDDSSGNLVLLEHLVRKQGNCDPVRYGNPLEAPAAGIISNQIKRGRP